MPANKKRRPKIKPDSVARTLLKLKGGIPMTRQREKKAASEFHEMPHMFQEAPAISEFMSGDSRKAHMKSILERNALDEFLDASLSSQAAYLRENAVRILVKQSDEQTKHQQMSAGFSGLCESERVIPIPRRPINYVSGKEEVVVSPDELCQLESRMFLNWRLELSKIEEKEGRAMTPFERNLEFWRQLWRVLERSDVVIQILDARNPLFFRSVDLENYVKEIHHDKEVILLLNKSDLISRDMRRKWFNYFSSKNVKCLFFSALTELNKLQLPTGQTRRSSSTSIESQSEDSTNLESNNLEAATESDATDLNVSESEDSQKNLETDESDSDPEPRGKMSGLVSYSLKESFTTDLEDSDTKILDSLQLISVFQQMRDSALQRRRTNNDCGDLNKRDDELKDYSEDKAEKEGSKQATTFQMLRDKDDVSYVVGFVGYPNVGKSSIINSILGHKAAAVSRQPGKTKHFQTLSFPEAGVTLCDCPGLVFPQIVADKSFLVVNGVSPIDHVRGDYLTPVQVVCDMIPNELLNRYKLLEAKKIADRSSPNPIEAAKNLDASNFLSLLATSRGYVRGGKGGLSDLYQSAKLVLRDFTTGKLRYSVFPPENNTIKELDVPKSNKQNQEAMQNSSDKLDTKAMAQVSDEALSPVLEDALLCDILGVTPEGDEKQRRMTKRRSRVMNKQLIKGKCIALG